MYAFIYPYVHLSTVFFLVFLFWRPASWNQETRYEMCEMSMDEIMTLSGERFEECLQGNVFFDNHQKDTLEFSSWNRWNMLEPGRIWGKHHIETRFYQFWGGAAKIHMNHPTYLPSFIAKPWSGRLMHYSAGENQKTYVLVRTRLQQLFFTRRTDVWTAAKRFVMQSGTYSFFLRKSFPQKTYIHSLLHFCFLALRASVQLKSKHVCPFGLHTWKEKLTKHDEACFVFGQDRCLRETVASVCMFFHSTKFTSLFLTWCKTIAQHLWTLNCAFLNIALATTCSVPFSSSCPQKRLMSPPGTEVFEATSPDWFHCVPDLDRRSPQQGLKCPCCFWIFQPCEAPQS